MSTVLQRQRHVSQTSPTAPSTAVDCVLHLGMPKTATTMLQMFLYPQHSQIEPLGKFHNSIRPRQFLNDVVCTFVRDGLSQPLTYDSTKSVRAMQQFVHTARGNGKTLVFSREGHSSGGEKRKRHQARAFHNAFGDCQVLFTIREPMSFIEANYFQHLKGYHLKEARHAPLVEAFGRPPYYFNINEWLDVLWRHPTRGTLDNLFIADTLEIYADEFGADRIKLLLYEQLKTNAATFADQLSEVLGVDSSESRRLIHQRIANDRWDVERISWLQNICRSPWRRWLYRLSPMQRNRLAIVPQGGFKGQKPKAELSDAWRERLLDIGRSQSRRLQQTWGLPLEQFGYPV
jgi:hypothetical protein